MKTLSFPTAAKNHRETAAPGAGAPRRGGVRRRRLLRGERPRHGPRAGRPPRDAPAPRDDRAPARPAARQARGAAPRRGRAPREPGRRRRAGGRAPRRGRALRDGLRRREVGRRVPGAARASVASGSSPLPAFARSSRGRPPRLLAFVQVFEGTTPGASGSRSSREDDARGFWQRRGRGVDATEPGESAAPRTIRLRVVAPPLIYPRGSRGGVESPAHTSQRRFRPRASRRRGRSDSAPRSPASSRLL